MEKMIKGKKVFLGKIDARVGWYLLHDLGRICGESLVHASEDRFASAVEALFKNSSREELFMIIEQLSKDIAIDGGKLDLRDYGFVAACIKESLLYNFEDFFSPLVNALENLRAPATPVEEEKDKAQEAVA